MVDRLEEKIPGIKSKILRSQVTITGGWSPDQEVIVSGRQPNIVVLGPTATPVAAAVNASDAFIDE